MSNSVHPALKRRSSRLAPKRWAAYFANHKNPYGALRIGWFREDLERIANRYHPEVGHLYTYRTHEYWLSHMEYEHLMEDPEFVAKNDKVRTYYYGKAIAFLEDPNVVCLHGDYTKELNGYLLDYIQMCDYIHLYKK